MIDALFNQTSYLAAKKMLDVTASRMDAIAANLANVETPNYRRIDLPASFELQLQAAIASGNQAQLQALKPELTIDTAAVAHRADGNTVDLEREMVQLHRTSLEHAVETQLVTGSLNRMRLAITGRPV